MTFFWAEISSPRTSKLATRAVTMELCSDRSIMGHLRRITAVSPHTAAIYPASSPHLVVSLSIHLHKLDGPVGWVLEMGHLLHKHYVVSLFLGSILRIDSITQPI